MGGRRPGGGAPLRYEVRLGGATLQVDLVPDGRLLVDGEPVAAEVASGRPDLWSIRLDGRSCEVIVLGWEPLRLQVDGREVSGSVVDERALAAGAGQARTGRGRHEVRAPMPGLLKAVHVREGDAVEAGAPLVTLEAMKMENELRAPGAGRVTSVAGAAGAKVEGGSLLVVLTEEA